VPSSKGGHCATHTIMLVSGNTSDVAGTALVGAPHPRSQNARNLVQQQCILPEPQCYAVQIVACITKRNGNHILNGIMLGYRPCRTLALGDSGALCNEQPFTLPPPIPPTTRRHPLASHPEEVRRDGGMKTSSQFAADVQRDSESSQPTQGNARI